MNRFAIFFLIFMVFSFLSLREIMALSIRDSMSRGERKKYKKNCSPLKRWFFLSTHTFLRDKYSKIEGRSIRYSSIAKAYCIINIVMHIVFIATMVAMIVHRLDADIQVLSMIAIMYISLWGCAVLALFITETITRRKYHRSRYP